MRSIIKANIIPRLLPILFLAIVVWTFFLGERAAILTATIFFIVVFANWVFKGKPIAAAYFLMVVFYEWLWYLIFVYTDGVDSVDVDRLLKVLAPAFKDNMSVGYGIVLFIFSMFSLIATRLPIQVGNDNFKTDVPKNYLINSFVFCLSTFVLITGVLSFISNVGQSRMSDYIGESQDVGFVGSLYSYATTILVVLYFFSFRYFSIKKIRYGIFTLVASAPLLIEMFLAGRRQIFVPIFLLIMWFVIRGNEKFSRRNLWYVVGCITAFFLFMAVQFAQRSVLQASVTNDEAIIDFSMLGILAPQLREFFGVGLISASAYSVFLDDTSKNIHGLYGVLNYLLSSLPVVKKLDVHDSFALDFMRSDMNIIAPYGALSIFAECIVFFGWAGVVIAGILTGLIGKFLEKSLHINNIKRITSLSAVYWLCLAVTLFPKYRSGFVDFIVTWVVFSLLFIIFVFFARFVSALSRANRI